MDPVVRVPSGWRFGFSIAETVVASFMLLLGFLVVARLFHSSLQYQVWVDSVNLATTTGEATLNSVRAWAQQPANFQNLESVYNPQTFQADGLQITIRAGTSISIYSPCSEFEQNSPLTDRRALNSSHKPVEVTVTWSRDSIKLNSLIGDPPRQLRAATPLAVSVPNGAVIPKNASIPITANLYDVGNNVVPDIFFSWAVEPISGRGTLQGLSRDGRSGQFIHKLVKPDGNPGFSPGVGASPSQCLVSATGVYRGAEVNQPSLPVSLEP